MIFIYLFYISKGGEKRYNISCIAPFQLVISTNGRYLKTLHKVQNMDFSLCFEMTITERRFIKAGTVKWLAVRQPIIMKG